MSSPLDRQQVVEAFCAYREWDVECARVRDAYQRWVGAPREYAELFFGAYQHALDREQRAADLYEATLMRSQTGHETNTADPLATLSSGRTEW